MILSYSRMKLGRCLMFSSKTRIISPRPFFRRSDIRLSDTIDDMFTFSQIDDHVVTLMKHTHHPQMVKAKSIIDKIEHRGNQSLGRSTSRLFVALRNLSLHRQYSHHVFHGVRQSNRPQSPLLDVHDLLTL